MERLVKDDLMVNVHFGNLNISRVQELYLFYRLRIYAQTRGGSIEGFAFTTHERYRLLPGLKRHGWIKRGFVVNYRKLCNRWQAVGIWVKMPMQALESLKAFKGFLIASSEAYILRRNDRLQNNKGKVYNLRDKTLERRDWVSRNNSTFWLKVKKIDLDGVNCRMGRVYVNTLEQMMGLSSRTITRWREESLNEYRNRYLTPGQVKSTRDESMFFYSKKVGSLVTIDQYIITDLDLFTLSKYNGIEYTYNAKERVEKKGSRKKNLGRSNPLHYYKTEMLKTQ